MRHNRHTARKRLGSGDWLLDSPGRCFYCINLDQFLTHPHQRLVAPLHPSLPYIPPLFCRHPRSVLSQAVLLNTTTHSDGTVTYSFGDSSNPPPAHAHHATASASAAAAVIDAPLVHHTNGASSTTGNSNGASSTAHHHLHPATSSLDKLLHLTPKLANGATSIRIGVNPDAHRLDTAAEAAVQKRIVLEQQQDHRHLHPTTATALTTATPPTTTTTTTKNSANNNNNAPSPPLSTGALNYAEASAATINKLYSRFCDAGRLDDALTVLKECIRAQRQDAVRMLKHYKFLRVAQRQRSVRRAMRFVQLLPRQFVDPRTYNMVISVCAESGDVKSALRVADMLRAAGHKMDAILYTNIIKTCAEAGDAERAFQLYNEMKNTGIKTEKKVYATLISACSEAILCTAPSDRRTQLVLLERAFSLLQGMQSARISTDAAVWNALITASGRAGQLQRAFDVLEDMLAGGCRPNARTYACLIDACARTGDKELALRVYTKALREGFTEDLIVYSAAINACVRCKTGSDLTQAMEIYADMQRAGVAPDSALFGALMMTAGSSGNLTLALDLQSEMEREGLQPCSGTLSALLTVHLLHGKLQEAQSIYKGLRAAGVLPHIHAVNALINAYGKQQRLGDAVALVCDMVDAGLTPDAFTFAAVLGACQRSDECELGLDVYRAFRARGLVLDSTVAEMMMVMCYNRLRQSWRSGGYPPQRLFSSHSNSSSDEEGGGGGGATSVVASVPWRSSRGSHREQEREKLLNALLPAGRKLAPMSDPSEVPWQSHAFHLYRETVAAGVRPSMRLLNLVFCCLRVPWKEATGDADASINLAAQTQRLMAGMPASPEGTATVQRKIGVESIYHVRAISILEEAIVSGLLPSFKAGVSSASSVDLRALPPAVAEVYVLTVVTALQRQVEGRREVQHKIAFLVPRYDGHQVFRPSFLTDSESESDVEGAGAGGGAGAVNKKKSKKKTASKSVDNHHHHHEEEEEEDDEEEDVFRGALKHSEECAGDARTGLGVAGVLRRLRLWAREFSHEGLIVIEPQQMTRWSKMIQREVEKRSASALALQKPYGQMNGTDLRRQSSSIRMKF